LTSTIPTGTRLRSLDIANGSALVDLSAAYATGGGSLSMSARLAQLTYTLTQFPTVKRVVYLLKGRRLRTLGGEGLIVDAPQTRALYEQARSDSLEAGLLGKVFIDRPAQGASFTSPLTITGSATRTFTLTVANWDGLILAERTIRNATGVRRPFSVSISADPGLYPRGTLLVRFGGTVTEIALGTAR
jgi:germination protein M